MITITYYKFVKKQVFIDSMYKKCCVIRWLARKWASFTVIRQVTFNGGPEGWCKVRFPHNRAKGGLSQDSQNIQHYSSIQVTATLHYVYQN